MRAFACPTCGRLITFETARCLHCETMLGFDPDRGDIRALDADAHRCVNERLAACNWIAPDSGLLCASFALTRTRPGDDDPDGLVALAAAEGAKRRLLFQLAVRSLDEAVARPTNNIDEDEERLAAAGRMNN